MGALAFRDSFGGVVSNTIFPPLARFSYYMIYLLAAMKFNIDENDDL